MAARRPVVWTERALQNLDEILDFIAADSLAAAREFVERVLDRADSLSTLGGRGRVVPRLEDPAIREVFVGVYRLVYRVESERIVLLTVLHGARRDS